jgi:membrane dipeptidase
MKKIILMGLASIWFSASLLAQDANKIHRKAILIDTHDDVISRQILSGDDIGKEVPAFDFDLVKAKRGGLDAQIFSIWGDGKIGFAHAQQEIDSLYSLIQRHPDKIALALTAADVRRTIKQGKLAAMIGVEGGHMIDDDLNKLNILAQRGMIYLTLTWNNSTQWASSAADESANKISDRPKGLNDFGKKVIQRLNELGVIVDLSHVGEQTFFDALAITTKPVILSHSCAYVLNPVPRNVTDEQIKALGKNGGVISVNFYNGFLDPNYDTAFNAFLAEHKEEYSRLKAADKESAVANLIKKHQAEFELLKPSIELLVAHIEHIVKLIGVDHVGIGADYDGATSYPKGLNNVADYPKLTEALLKRGFSARDIEKIYGENFLRVLKANKGK